MARYPEDQLKSLLERLYRLYNRRELVHPDPLEFLYNYPDPLDREIAGLLASCLAYGRVTQILKSISTILSRMGPSPAQFLRTSTKASLEETFAGFKHRFTKGKDVAMALVGAREIIKNHGSLGNFFTGLVGADDQTVIPALSRFLKEIGRHLPAGSSFMLPHPDRGSACKRPLLFLRWMIRRDEVDPGGWNGVPPSKLVIPLDTHMYQVAKALGFTGRKQANLKTALEVTEAFSMLCPEDPVKYDFALTRFGIHPDMGPEELWAELEGMGRPLDY